MKGEKILSSIEVMYRTTPTCATAFLSNVSISAFHD